MDWLNKIGVMTPFKPPFVRPLMAGVFAVLISGAGRRLNPFTTGAVERRWAGVSSHG